MMTVTVSDAALRQAAEEGMDEFVKVFIDGIQTAIGGQLTNENMARLNADQITLLGWSYLHEEVSDGGYVQLIYNGLGAFIFKNPFARMMREWGLQDLYSHLQRCKKWYTRYHEQLEHEMSDDDFMAIYEQMPEFDDFEVDGTDSSLHRRSYQRLCQDRDPITNFFGKTTGRLQDESFAPSALQEGQYHYQTTKNEQGRARKKKKKPRANPQQEGFVRIFLR